MTQKIKNKKQNKKYKDDYTLESHKQFEQLPKPGSHLWRFLSYNCQSFVLGPHLIIKTDGRYYDNKHSSIDSDKEILLRNTGLR